MLLPAALDLMHVRRVVIPPHPGNFSALGLLSTDLVYYDSRSAYVPLSPESAPQIAAVFEEMERGLRERAGKGRRRSAAASTAASSARAGRRRSCRSPTGRSTRRRSSVSSASTRRTSGATATASRTSRCRASATASSCVVPSEKVEFAPRDGGRRGARRAAPDDRAPLPRATSRSQAAEYERERAAGRRARRRPGGDPRGALDHLRRPRPDRRGRPPRRARDRARAVRTAHDRVDPRPRRARSSRSATAATASPRPCSRTASATSSSTCARGS